MQGRLTGAAPAELLGRGLALFPLPAGSKRATAGWQQRTSTDPGDIAGWPDGANIGVGCRASKVVGLDLDHKHEVDGAATFRALCDRAGDPWPDTLTVSTPHGQHLYFRAPGGVVIPSLIARWPGIDVRAPGRHLGGYLVGPGSVVGGQPYAIVRDLPIAPLPVWLIYRLTKSAPKAQNGVRR